MPAGTTLGIFHTACFVFVSLAVETDIPQDSKADSSFVHVAETDTATSHNPEPRAAERL